VDCEGKNQGFGVLVASGAVTRWKEKGSVVWRCLFYSSNTGPSAPAAQKGEEAETAKQSRAGLGDGGNCHEACAGSPVEAG
jgi:hypothetical protein